MKELNLLEIQEVSGASSWRFALKWLSRTGGLPGPNRYTGEFMG